MESAARVRPKQQKTNNQSAPPGLAARNLAVHLVAGVLIDKQPLEQVLAAAIGAAAGRGHGGARPGAGAGGGGHRAAPAGRAGACAQRVPGAAAAGDKGRLWPILLTGAAQLVCLDMPAHAVVDLAVEATRRDRGAQRFAKLVNAVLRRVAERGRGAAGGPGPHAPQRPRLAVAALEHGLRR